MASKKELLLFLQDQLSSLEGVESRPMMGEYLLYYKNKLIGGFYDNRFLVKPVPAAHKLLPDAPLVLPYEGSSAMLLVEQIDNRALLTRLLLEMQPELPARKPSKKRGSL